MKTIGNEPKSPGGIILPGPMVKIVTTMPNQAPKPLPQEFARYNVPIIGGQRAELYI